MHAELQPDPSYTMDNSETPGLNKRLVFAELTNNKFVSSVKPKHKVPAIVARPRFELFREAAYKPSGSNGASVFKEEEREKLLLEIENLRAKHYAWEAERSMLLDQVGSMESMQHQSLELVETCESLQSQCLALQKANDENEITVSQLTAKIDAATEQLFISQDQLSHAHDAIRESDQRRKQELIESRHQLDQLPQLIAENKQYELELLNLSARLQSESSQHGVKEQEYQKQLAESQVHALVLEDRINGLLEKRDVMQDEMRSLNLRLDSTQLDVTNKRNDLAQKTTDLTLLQETVSQKDEELNYYRSEYHQARKDVESYASQVAKLRSQVDEYLSKFHDQEELLESVNAGTSLLVNNLDQTESEKNAIRSELDIALSTMKSLNEERCSLSALLEQQKSKSEILERDLSSAIESASQSAEQIAGLKEQVHTLASGAELSKANSAENERLKQSLTTVTLELSKLKSELDSSEIKSSMAEDDLTREKHKTAALQDEMDLLQVAHLGYKKENEVLTNRVATLSKLAETGMMQVSEMGELRTTIEELKVELNGTKQKLVLEQQTRRYLHEQLLNLKGNIRVFCRIRPFMPNEPIVDTLRIDDNDGQASIAVIQEAEGFDSRPLKKQSAFPFDRVFGTDADNHSIFEEVGLLIQSAIDGSNICIFAYGQTGSGKTYTMGSSEGIIALSLDKIFSTMNSTPHMDYSLSGEFVEIYNESVYDLLSDKKTGRTKLEIRHDASNRTTSIINATTVQLKDRKTINNFLMMANSRRSVGSTKANERSSRSHSAFILHIEGTNTLTKKKTRGTLNLVDLAGSERLDQTMVTGDRLQETQAINKSLSSLGDVIHALASGRVGTHVPYRNSKLTYLLQYSLCGSSKTLMIVNVSPAAAHLNETVSSLRFATKVNQARIR